MERLFILKMLSHTSAGNEGHMRWHSTQDMQYLCKGFCISVLFIKFVLKKYIHTT